MKMFVTFTTERFHDRFVRLNRGGYSYQGSAVVDVEWRSGDDINELLIAAVVKHFWGEKVSPDRPVRVSIGGDFRPLQNDGLPIRSS